MKLLIPTFLLSLMIWVVFYALRWRLLPNETIVVTGLCFIVVALIDWLSRKFRKASPRSAKLPEKKSKHSTIVKTILLAAIALHARVAVAGPRLCNIDRPTAKSGDRVDLSLLREPEDTEATQFRWSSPAGTIEGTGPDVKWNLAGVAQGAYTARLLSGSSANTSEVCSVLLYVIEVTRGTSGRGLLVRGQEIPPGYALYTFLAFASPPDNDSRDRYLAAITAFLRLSPSLSELDGLVSKQQLNANFVPVDSSPVADVDAMWILRHYDYARARDLLSVTSQSYFAGPYLLSASPSAGAQPGLSSPFLLQDLSIVPAHLVAAWYEQFLVRAAQQNFSLSHALQDSALWIRTAIGILALGVPDVEAGVDKWIKFVH